MSSYCCPFAYYPPVAHTHGPSVELIILRKQSTARFIKDVVPTRDGTSYQIACADSVKSAVERLTSDLRGTFPTGLVGIVFGTKLGER